MWYIPWNLHHVICTMWSVQYDLPVLSAPCDPHHKIHTVWSTPCDPQSVIHTMWSTLLSACVICHVGSTPCTQCDPHHVIHTIWSTPCDPHHVVHRVIRWIHFVWSVLIRSTSEINMTYQHLIPPTIVTIIYNKHQVGSYLFYYWFIFDLWTATRFTTPALVKDIK